MRRMYNNIHKDDSNEQEDRDAAAAEKLRDKRLVKVVSSPLRCINVSGSMI